MAHCRNPTLFSDSSGTVIGFQRDPFLGALGPLSVYVQPKAEIRHGSGQQGRSAFCFVLHREPLDLETVEQKVDSGGVGPAVPLGINIAGFCPHLRMGRYFVESSASPTERLPLTHDWRWW